MCSHVLHPMRSSYTVRITADSYTQKYYSQDSAALTFDNGRKGVFGLGVFDLFVLRSSEQKRAIYNRCPLSSSSSSQFFHTSGMILSNTQLLLIPLISCCWLSPMLLFFGCTKGSMPQISIAVLEEYMPLILSGFDLLGSKVEDGWPPLSLVRHFTGSEETCARVHRIFSGNGPGFQCGI